jgi:hypothetical protein
MAHTSQLPTPVKIDSRTCFGIAYFSSEADAARYAARVKLWDRRYNGGYFDGMPCRRDTTYDYTDPTLGRLFAVTY